MGIYTVFDGVVANEAWSGPAGPAHPSFPVTQGLTAPAIGARAVAVSNDVVRDPRYLANQDDSGCELIVPVLADLDIVGTSPSWAPSTSKVAVWAPSMGARSPE